MKHCVVVLSYLLTSYLFAKDYPTSSLNYIPKEKDLYGSSEIEIDSSEASASYQSYLIDTDSDTTTFSQLLGLGITDRLSVGVQFSYLLDGETQSTISGQGINTVSSGKVESDGLKDPEIGLIYRLFSEEETSGNLDLSLTFSPKTGDGESGTSSRDENAKRGGSQFLGSVSYGKFVNENFEFVLSFVMVHNTSRDVKSLSNNTNTKYDSSTNFGFSGDVQYYANERAFLNGTLGMVVYDDTVATDSTNVKTTYKYDPGFLVGLGAGYEVVDNKVNLSLGYSYSKYDFEVSDSSSSSIVFKGDVDGGAVRVGAQYVF